jgi:hypothetical protein
MRCLGCGLLIVALSFEYVTGSREHDPCAWVHDCTDAIEQAMPPSLHVPGDSDQRVEIHDGKAYLAGGSPEFFKPINLRFSDAFEFKDEVLIARG